MTENIIIGIAFLGAVAYLINVLRKQFSAKSSGCASCSGNCKVTDFGEIENKFKHLQN